MSAPKRELAIATGVMSALSLLFYRSFLGGTMLFAYDQTRSSLMFREYYAHALTALKSFPLWDKYIFSGLPFMGVLHGDPFYPSSLVRLLLPGSVVMDWNFVVHTALAGVLFYALLRRFGVGFALSLVFGVSYAFTASIGSLTYAGHENKLMVAAWLPGVIYAVDVALERPFVRYFALAALLLALDLVSPHAQQAYYSYLSVALYFGVMAVTLLREKRYALVKPTVLLIAAVAASLALAAAQFIPTYYYTQAFSPRVGKGYDYSITWSLPWEDLLGSVIPRASGYLESYWGTNPLKHNSEYVGALVVAFVPLGVALARRNRRVLACITASAFFVLLALGGNTPLFRLFYLLPGLKAFRAPSQAFIPAAFFLNLTAAFGAHALSSLRPSVDKKLKRYALYLGGALAGLGVIALIAPDGTASTLASLFGVRDPQRLALLARNMDAFGFGALRVGLLATALIYILLAHARGALKRVPAIMLAGGLVTADLWLVDADFLKPADKSLYTPDNAVKFLKAQPGTFRVLPLFYHVDDNYLMRHGVESVGGSHGLQFKRYQEYLGTPQTVMFVPQALRNLYANHSMLNALNARFIVTQPLPKSLAGLDPRTRQVLTPIVELLAHTRLVFRTTDVEIYENDSALARAFFVSRFSVVAPESALARTRAADLSSTAVLESDPGFAPSASATPPRAQVSVVEREPNGADISVTTDRAGILVYSGNWYPFWRATVDGEEVPVIRTDYVLRGVPIRTPGKHAVRMWFDGRLERMGILVSLISLGVVLLATGLSFAFERRRKGA